MRNALILLCANTLLACHTPQNDEVGSKPKGYLNSPTYREYLRKYPDKTKTLESDKDFFSLVGEHDFISNEKFDFYSIYLFKNSRDSILNLYSIKEKGNQCWVSHRTFNENKYPKTSNGYKYSEMFIVDTLTRPVDSKAIKVFKQTLDAASKNIKEVLPNNYDSPLRITFYFDGKEYYRLSTYQLDEDVLNRIDTLFRNSPIFKQ